MITLFNYNLSKTTFDRLRTPLHQTGSIRLNETHFIQGLRILISSRLPKPGQVRMEHTFIRAKVSCWTFFSISDLYVPFGTFRDQIALIPKLISEHGHRFTIDYLPNWSWFWPSVQLEVLPSLQIQTRNTLNDAANDVDSDQCLCFTSNFEFILSLVKLCFFETPQNYIIIPSLVLLVIAIALLYVYCRWCDQLFRNKRIIY